MRPREDRELPEGSWGVSGRAECRWSPPHTLSFPGTRLCHGHFRCGSSVLWPIQIGEALALDTNMSDQHWNQVTVGKSTLIQLKRHRPQLEVSVERKTQARDAAQRAQGRGAILGRRTRKRNKGKQRGRRAEGERRGRGKEEQG